MFPFVQTKQFLTANRKKPQIRSFQFPHALVDMAQNIRAAAQILTRLLRSKGTKKRPIVLEVQSLNRAVKFQGEALPASTFAPSEKHKIGGSPAASKTNPASSL